MTAINFLLQTFLISIAAGAFRALLGLGAGVILIPVLTFWLGVDIHSAIGASFVVVIATSSGASATYLRKGLANIHNARFLETGTSAGVIFCAFIAGYATGSWLFVLFGIMFAYSAFAQFRRRDAELTNNVSMDPIVAFLHLNS